MALDYENFRTLAERLIGENGRTLTLIKIDRGNPVDVSEPWRDSTDAAEVLIPITGVFIEFETEDIDGTLVRRGDKRVLVAAIDVEQANKAAEDVENFDKILDGLVSWKIQSVEIVEPGSLTIMYDLHVRQM